MSAPIWPQIIYSIGKLPDAEYYAVIGETGFSYCKNLPEFEDFEFPLLDEEDIADTEPNIHVEWDESYPRAINGALVKAS